MAIPVCDDCGNGDFEVVCINPPKEEKTVPASEYFKSGIEPVGVPAIMVYQRWVATCKKCGREYKFTR